MAARAEQEETISNETNKCIDLLKRLVICIACEVYEYHEIFPERSARKSLERLMQWATITGSQRARDDRMSLDARLEEAPGTRRFVLHTLFILKHTTHDAITIASGERTNREAPLISRDELMISDSSSSSEGSDLSISELVPNSPGQNGFNEIEELDLSIQQSINTLMRTSMFIRKYARDDRRKKAMSRSPVFNNSSDINHILEKFPYLAKHNRGLAESLGEANARRRQYFKYCRDHVNRQSIGSHERTNEGSVIESPKYGIKDDSKELRDDQTTLPTISKGSQSRATDLTKYQFLASDGQDATNMAALESANENLSTISRATTIDDKSNGISFPPIPFEAKNGSAFLCPFCQTFQSVGTKSPEINWRKHVIKDLQPYMCTLPGCTMDTFESQHAWIDHEVSIHRCEWHCQYCKNLVFGDSSELEQHIQRSHTSKATASQLPALLSRARRPLQYLSAQDCPFCDELWAFTEDNESRHKDNQIVYVSLEEFRNHVADHFVAVALFALPRPDMSTNEDQLTNVARKQNSQNQDSKAWDDVEDQDSAKEKVSRRRKKFVLCFDGGGLRGISGLLILRKLMRKIGKDFAYDLFDAIFGISTGGLSAILLGVLSWSIDHCVLFMELWIGKVTNDVLSSNLGVIGQNSIGPILDIIEEDRELLHRPMLNGNPHSRPSKSVDTCVFSHQYPIPSPFQLDSIMNSTTDMIPICSYKGSRGPEVSILNAINQTLETTRFFPTATQSGTLHLGNSLMDLNPAEEAWKEFQRKHGYSLKPNDVCFISIGVGNAATGNDNSEESLHLAIMATRASHEAIRFIKDNEPFFTRGENYFRFSADDLGCLIEDHSSMENIRTQTERYLSTPPVRHQLSRLANLMKEELGPT